MPTHVLARERELPLPDERARLDRMPGARVPVMRQLWDESDRLPYWAYARFSGNHLFDLANDPDEMENLVGDGAERRSAEALEAALKAVDAPHEQLVRLGLS
jgi:hypothetical protein